MTIMWNIGISYGLLSGDKVAYPSVMWNLWEMIWIDPFRLRGMTFGIEPAASCTWNVPMSSSNVQRNNTPRLDLHGAIENYKPHIQIDGILGHVYLDI